MKEKKYLVTEKQLIGLGLAVGRYVRANDRYIGKDLKEFRDCLKDEYHQSDWRKEWKESTNEGDEILHACQIGHDFQWVFFYRELGSSVVHGRYNIPGKNPHLVSATPVLKKMEEWVLIRDDEVVARYKSEEQARNVWQYHLGTHLVKLEGSYEE